MSVKILGGDARGFSLSTPKTLTTRPTSVLVRRKLFDWRQRLDGLVFVDLFAGSGAMAFEALSRGADRVYVNDSHRIAFQTLKQNAERFLAAFRLETDRVVVSNQDALRWLGRELGYELVNAENTIIYLDPPYEEHELYLKVLEELKRQQFAGEVWLEADRLKGPRKEQLVEAFQSVLKTVEQGDHFVLVGKVI